MKRTNLYLDERQTTALDQVAREQGVSRAEVVRRLVDRSLGADPADLDNDLAAIEASFGALGDADILERGPDERSAHLDNVRRR